MKKKSTSGQQTMHAVRRFTRRTFLKSAGAAGSLAAMGPWVVADAQSSSGSLNMLNWDDEQPTPMIAAFEKKTGIKVNMTPFSQNEEQINKLQATKGAGLRHLPADPRPRAAVQGHRRAGAARREEARHRQHPAVGAQRLEDELDVGRQALSRAALLGHGSDFVAQRPDQDRRPPTLSYGTLWNDEYKGKVQGRPHSLLLGIGLWMDGDGKLKTNRMLDAYKDEDSMKKVYDVLLKEAIARKPWIKQFWDSADNTKSGFMSNGCVIGQTWDGPAISLKKAGQPITFMAPKEGAIGWVDGWSLTKAAKNIDQAYEFMKFVHSAEGSAMVAEGSGYNPVRQGRRRAALRQGQGDLQGGLSRPVARSHVVASGRAVVVRRTARPVCREVQGCVNKSNSCP